MGVFVHVDTARKFFHEGPGFAFSARGGARRERQKSPEGYS